MIRIETSNAERIRLRIVGTIEKLRDVGRPLLDAAMMERDEAVLTIKMGGDPPWPPSKKTLGSSFVAPSSGKIGTSRTGKGGGMFVARGEIVQAGGYGQTGVDEGTMMRAVEEAQPVLEDPTTVAIGINVRTADGKYNYAKIFQQGSGTYAGHTAWTINAAPGKVLAWQVGGVWFYSRSVTNMGQPPRPFLKLHPEKVVAIFRAWIRDIIRPGGQAAA